jgi:hypothetical protein
MKNFLKPSISTSLVFFFFLVLLFLGLFAEVFESQAPQVNLAQIYANPIPIAELQRLKTLKITNKNGSFVFENTHPEGLISGPWQMLEPQPLKVKGDIINKILEILNVLRVRNFHRMEPINITSFSLDNPTLSLNFQTVKNKNYEVKVGLINPIDNSAYLTVSSQDQIYQIDPLEMALESYDLSQLVESKILALNVDSMAALELYEQNNLVLKFSKKDDQWLDQEGSQLSPVKVTRFFERLEDLKSTSILNNLSTEQKDFLNKTMTSSYTLKIISSVGVRNYFFGKLKNVTETPGLPKEVQGSYVMTSEDRDAFVLIDTQELNVFQASSKEFK